MLAVPQLFFNQLFKLSKNNMKTVTPPPPSTHTQPKTNTERKKKNGGLKNVEVGKGYLATVNPVSHSLSLPDCFICLRLLIRAVIYSQSNSLYIYMKRH